MDDMIRYNPKPGSALHIALQQQQAAVEAAHDMQLKLASLKSKKAQQRAILDSLTFDTPAADIAQAHALISAYDVLIAKAQAEADQRNEARRAAATPAHRVIDKIQKLQNRIGDFQKYLDASDGKGQVFGMAPHLAQAEVTHLQAELAAHLAANC